jgi:hypothetical protein
VNAEDPVAVVERQLAAYNARDMESFAATYSDDVTIERVVGIREGPLEALAIYEVAGGLIRAVWFFYPAEPFPGGPAKQ